MTATYPGIIWRRPGLAEVALTHAVFDFNGTLAVDGTLSSGVAAALTELAKILPISILTGDTNGTARRSFADLPVQLQICSSGQEKSAFIRELGQPTIAVGNGRNDLEMFKVAALSIAVIGSEGVSARLLGAATVIVTCVHDAFEILRLPKRLTSTTHE